MPLIHPSSDHTSCNRLINPTRRQSIHPAFHPTNLLSMQSTTINHAIYSSIQRATSSASHQSSDSPLKNSDSPLSSHAASIHRSHMHPSSHLCIPSRIHAAFHCRSSHQSHQSTTPPSMHLAIRLVRKLCPAIYSASPLFI